MLVNNYYGRQFTSLNDIAVNPRNGELYFTDPDYGETARMHAIRMILSIEANERQQVTSKISVRSPVYLPKRIV